MSPYAIHYDDVEAAAARIAGRVHVTPVVTCRTLDQMCGRQLFFKCEHLQRTGAFKIRGATNSVLVLPDHVTDVVTHSSGNHAQAVAVAAREAGLRAHVVMPTNTVRSKVDAVRGYGAEIIECEPTLAAREAVAERVLESTKGFMIHPFDHGPTIAGQGTVALELLSQVDELEAVVTPVGGGGLISGVATVVRKRAPHLRVIGAEPTGAADASNSKASGTYQPERQPDTIADGLRGSLAPDTTWPMVRDLVDEVLTVSDDQIIEAMRLLWERAKLMVEPSAATTLAAIKAMPRGAGPQRIGVVLSGGNVDLDRYPWRTS